MFMLSNSNNNSNSTWAKHIKSISSPKKVMNKHCCKSNIKKAFTCYFLRLSPHYGCSVHTFVALGQSLMILSNNLQYFFYFNEISSFISFLSPHQSKHTYCAAHTNIPNFISFLNELLFFWWPQNSFHFSNFSFDHNSFFLHWWW